MNLEKYGGKLIKLLSKLERYLDPYSQIGGVSESTSDKNYIKELSYSVNHVSILVHLGKVEDKKAIETPQISYEMSKATEATEVATDTTTTATTTGAPTGDNKINKYSVEQQLRLGCDESGNMYNFSMVLTFNFKNKLMTES